jgi:uncharacterized protein (TIGR01777 family)
MQPTVLLAGGTGLIGSRLAEMLIEKNFEVRILTRSPKAENHFAWDVEKSRIDDAALRGVTALINLAGEGIADGRWTRERKRRILASRTDSARLLGEALQRLGERPETYIGSSAIGFYGNSGERMMHEPDPPVGGGFMVDVCKAWEQATQDAGQRCGRTLIFRTGIVLSAEGGALAELVKPVRFGVGAYFGDGRAWYSWIHRDDLCRAFVWALENPAADGVYNAVAPYPVRNKDLIRAVAAARHHRALPAPVPAFALRLALGEMADTILNSNRVSAEKLLQAGFKFDYPELQAALNQIFTK